MKNQSVFEQSIEGEASLKSWAVPVVEIHEIEQLTASGGTSFADAGISS